MIKLILNEIHLNKIFFNKLQKVLIIFNTAYGRRHLKLFINCHVSWDTMYLFNLSIHQ